MLQTTRSWMGALLAACTLAWFTYPIQAQQTGNQGYGPIPITVDSGSSKGKLNGQPIRGPIPLQFDGDPPPPPSAFQQAPTTPVNQTPPTFMQGAVPQQAPPAPFSPRPAASRFTNQVESQPAYRTAANPQAASQTPLQPSAPAAAAGAAPAGPTMPEEELTLDQIEALRQAAEGSTELDEEKKKIVAGLYRDAAAKVKEAQDLAAKTAAMMNESKSEIIAQRLEALKLSLAELQKRKQESFADVPLAELEQRQAKQEVDNTTYQKNQAVAESEPKRRIDRRKEIRQWMADAPGKFNELRQASEAISPDENPFIAQALKTKLMAQRLALYRQYVNDGSELASYDAEESVNLLRYERDLASQNLAFAQQTTKAIADEVKKKRAQAAQEAVQQARVQLIMVHPALRSYAEGNQRLAETSQEITQKLEKVVEDSKKAEDDLTALRKQFRSTREKVDQLGLTSSIGVLLRKQRTELFKRSPWKSGSPDRQAQIEDAQFKHFEYDEQRSALLNPDDFVQQILKESDLKTDAERVELQAAAREVFDRKQEYLDQVNGNLIKYVDELIELRSTEKQTAEVIVEFQKYIDKRVLWIRSGNILVTELLTDSADKSFLMPSNWIEVAQALWSDVKQNPLVYMIVTALLVALLLKQQKLKSDLCEFGVAAQKPGFFGFWPTIHSIIYTLILASVKPAFIAFVGWRLMQASSNQAFAIAVGHGLYWTAVLWFPLELLRYVCRDKGLGDAHFKWPDSSLLMLSKNLGWMMVLILPLSLVTTTFYALDPTHGHDAIERICFILQCVVMAGFLARILQSSGVFQEYLAYNQGGWANRLKFIWYWGAVSTPLVLAGLAFWGYYYTAQVISWRLFATVCCLLGMLLLRESLMRWIMLARRKLSIAQARERAAAAASQSGDSAAASLSNSILAEQAKEELSAYSAQTQRLLATGMFTLSLLALWLVWGQFTPALKMLDDYSYSIGTTEQVADAGVTGDAEKTPAADGEEKSPSEQVAAATGKKITILTIGFAALIMILTLVFARDIPGVMEMTILQRLPLEPSVRYAITSLTSYAIVMIGIVWTFGSLGLEWSQIQWLITALTFGLAFGLQEMFANFVAGIIILFERPVRVGDIVTIDDVTGVVSRIRIRATSITNWDRKEYVVPNKEFITGRLLNWTLSDTVNRVVINVGVAYGTDTEEARRILLQIAEKNPYLLKEPTPMATFEGFGDSTLDLVLRAFLPNLENRLLVINDLHTEIDKAFRDAEIEIAFPQRDLHIRTVPGAALALGIPEEQENRPVGEARQQHRGAA
ncbi:mechanosensitive ion channel [bacterium]|nr:mechanosensitive ion channel [bacterium]